MIDEKEIENFKVLLKQNFKTKYLGLPSNYLAVNIEQDLKTGRTIINKRKYSEIILETFGMSDCKGSETPIDKNFDFEILKREKSDSKLVEKQCKQIFGSYCFS